MQVLSDFKTGWHIVVCIEVNLHNLGSLGQALCVLRVDGEPVSGYNLSITERPNELIFKLETVIIFLPSSCLLTQVVCLKSKPSCIR